MQQWQGSRTRRSCRTAESPSIVAQKQCSVETERWRPARKRPNQRPQAVNYTWSFSFFYFYHFFLSWLFTLNPPYLSHRTWLFVPYSNIEIRTTQILLFVCSRSANVDCCCHVVLYCSCCTSYRTSWNVCPSLNHKTLDNKNRWRPCRNTAIPKAACPHFFFLLVLQSPGMREKKNQ